MKKFNLLEKIAIIFNTTALILNFLTLATESGGVKNILFILMHASLLYVIYTGRE